MKNPEHIKPILKRWISKKIKCPNCGDIGVVNLNERHKYEFACACCGLRRLLGNLNK
jgi:hypothetical protein